MNHLGLAVLIVGCASVHAADRDDASVAPAPAPPAVSWAHCERCHGAEASSHSGSMHAAASRDPLFQRELAMTSGRSFCTGCHAPAGEAGVDCAACHVSDGHVLSARASGRAPHPTEARPERATDAACAGCHEFDFRGRPGAPMQRTLTEAASRTRVEGTCVSCHMVEGDHAFAIDDAQLARAVAVRVSAERDGQSVQVRVVLRAGEVGHAVPTGDLYRRLELRVWIAGAPRSVRTVTLARTFESGSEGLVEIGDTRVPPPGLGARRLALELPGEGDQVRWELGLLALPRDRAERDGLLPMLWSRVVTSGHADVR